MATSAPLIVIAGTGTEIGKTHFACGLVLAWARGGGRVAGVKPIESGVVGAVGEDAAALGRMSTFHVQHSAPPYMLTRAVSPHLAAREAGISISLDVVLAWTAPLRRQADAIVLELPGGLYSPVSDTASNADLTRALAPTATILVAPDRLGVLHDLGAATRAASADSIALTGIVLSPPSARDLSTGSNAAEVALVTKVPVLATLPRAPSASADFVDACTHVLQRLSLL